MDERKRCVDAVMKSSDLYLPGVGLVVEGGGEV